MDFFDYLKNNKLIITVISILLNIVLLGGIIFLIISKNEVDNCDECICESKIESNNIDEADKNIINVEVKGAVNSPGVYQATSDNIINDAINLAGGFKNDSFTNNINLSKRLTDELVVYVYTNKEYQKLKDNKEKKEEIQIKEVIVKEPCECKTYDISNCTDYAQSEIISSTIDTEFTDEKDTTVTNEDNKSNIVNINSASKDELLTLSGIGEAKAVAIIEYRTLNGQFKTIEELLNVKGIGQSIFEKIKDNIRV